MIAIIDYGMGNLRSVEKAFRKFTDNVIVTSKAEDIEKASAVVLPGVGAFRDCMNNLKRLDLLESIKDAIKQGKPYLGICLGLQVLFEESEEFGRTRGLGILPGRVVRFSEKMGLKIPHMGWNQVHIKRHSPLFEGISEGDFFYFVHSFYVVPEDEAIITTTTDYGIEFVSSVQKNNIFALQFHPEKSQSLGLRLIENFVKSLN